MALALGGFCALGVAQAADAPKGARINDVYIISGASGQLGELAIQEFRAHGVPAKNLILVSRSPEKLADYARRGASVRTTRSLLPPGGKLTMIRTGLAG